MQVITSRDRFVGFLLVLSIVAAASTSCSGGGGGSSASGAMAPASPSGDWNFFRTGTSCFGAEFAALPLRIDDSVSGVFPVHIGEGSDAFLFAGVFQSGTLSVAGTDAIGGTTLEILEADWALSSDGLRLTGPMRVMRTEGGTPCLVEDAIDAYRVDATNLDPVIGPWEWTLTTRASSGGCNQLDDLARWQVEILPKQQGAFVVDAFDSLGHELRFDAQRNGQSLLLSGASGFDTTLLSLEANSSFEHDTVAERLAGELSFQLDDGVFLCDATQDLSAVRAGLGESYLPFVRDAGGANELVGVIASIPGATLTLEDHLGLDVSAGDAFPVGLVHERTDLVEKGAFDETTFSWFDLRPDSLFVQETGSLLRYDLELRVDAEGDLVPPTGDLILDGSNGAWGAFEAEGHFSDLEAVVFAQRADASAGMVVEIAPGGARRSIAVPFAQFVGVQRYVGSGAFAGVVLMTPANTLLHVTADEVKTVGTDVVQAMVPSRGDAMFIRQDGMRFLYPNGSTNLIDGTQPQYIRLLATQGGSLFYAKRNPSFPNSLTVVGYGVPGWQTLGSVNDTDPALNLSTHVVLVPTETRAVVQYKASDGELHLASFPLTGGTPLDITPPFDFDLAQNVGGFAPVAMGDSLHYNVDDLGVVRAVRQGVLSAGDSLVYTDQQNRTLVEGNAESVVRGWREPLRVVRWSPLELLSIDKFGAIGVLASVGSETALLPVSSGTNSLLVRIYGGNQHPSAANVSLLDPLQEFSEVVLTAQPDSIDVPALWQ